MISSPLNGWWISIGHFVTLLHNEVSCQLTTSKEPILFLFFYIGGYSENRLFLASGLGGGKKESKKKKKKKKKKKNPKKKNPRILQYYDGNYSIFFFFFFFLKNKRDKKLFKMSDTKGELVSLPNQSLFFLWKTTTTTHVNNYRMYSLERRPSLHGQAGWASRALRR